MKAAVYHGPGKINLEEREVPRAGLGEVIVKIKYCGICGTDIHAYRESGIAIDGIALGHENVGTIAEVGEGVQGWKPGDRVIAGPPGPCGNCYYCRHGSPNFCMNTFEQTNGLRRDGGFAEYMKVKDPAGMLYKIPDSVPFEDAVLFDVVCVGIKGIRESIFKFGDNVVVAGAGAIGLSTIQLLRLAGARHLTVLEPSAAKREMAIKTGADLVLDPVKEGPDLENRIRSLYNGIGADVTFECAGASDAFHTCLQLLKKGGQLLNLGVNAAPSTIITAFAIIQEVQIKLSLAYASTEVEVFLDMLTQKRIKTAGMISDIIKLDDIIGKGFNRQMNSNEIIKILVTP